MENKTENNTKANNDTRLAKILHVDGDNFFVACELARFPHLKGRPVIVGEERGIASAMSYEAKKLGVHRGMPVFEIREKFPQVIILPSHFELYEQYAEKLYTVLCKYSDKVERYSIDECFALISLGDIKAHNSHDATNTESSTHESSKSFLEIIKEEAELCLGITLSFGLADTKTLAKIGSKYDKPSGCVTINESDRIRFLKETEIGKVWGIGRAISAELTSYNIRTAFDFINLDRAFVQKNFGEGTLTTWSELRGERCIGLNTESRIPKSLQSTRSFGKSFNIFSTQLNNGALQAPKERSFFLSELSNHAESLCARLRIHRLSTNRISFFLKKNTLSNRYISREVQIGFYTNNASDLCKAIYKECENIFNELDNEILGVGVYNTNNSGLFGWSTHSRPQHSQPQHHNQAPCKTLQNFGFKIKSTGISVYQLRPLETVQDDLFAVQSTLDNKSQYTEVIDSLRRRLGDDSVYLCSSLESKKRRDEIFQKRNLKNKFIYGLPLPYMGEVI
ncbi:MAG: DNA polymerase IV [Candidatus Pacebacteria bacterium]|nr:DNA polymerase IV [Candidatus Paceibacterota bacterium]